MPQKIVKYLLLLLVLFAGITTDQVSKHWAAENMKNQSTKLFVPHFVELGYTENHGMVFGINNRSDNSFSKNTLLIVRIVLSIGLTGFLIFHLSQSLPFHLPFLLILSGAVGNVIDSLRFGHVIDFIHLHLGTLLDWPFLFNLADAYVVFGMGILIIQSFHPSRKHPSSSPSPGNDSVA